jgi:hypothetical protein
MKETIRALSFFFTVHFPCKDTENYTLEYSFQHMLGNLPGQTQKVNSYKPE